MPREARCRRHQQELHRSTTMPREAVALSHTGNRIGSQRCRGKQWHRHVFFLPERSVTTHVSATASGLYRDTCHTKPLACEIRLQANTKELRDQASSRSTLGKALLERQAKRRDTAMTSCCVQAEQNDIKNSLSKHMQNLTGGVDVEKGGVEDDGCTALVSPLPVVEAGRPPRRSRRLRRS